MRTFFPCLTASLFAALLALGCNNPASVPDATRPETKPEKKVPDTRHSGETAADKHAGAWGTVKGRLTWGGKSPFTPAKAEVTKDQQHCLSKGAIFKEEYVVGPDGGIANVFVWLIDATDPAHPKAPPIHPSLKEPAAKEVVMDQPCCKFEPHALALRQGQVLIAKNSSPVSHNFKWEGNGTGDNPLIPAGGQVAIKDLEATQKVYQVNCGIHPWMHAWFRVFDHPYFAVTGADGKYEIKDAPAGKYNLVMWHEGQGWVNGGKAGQAVEIKGGGVTEVDGRVLPSQE
jgi:hypothetical protein